MDSHIILNGIATDELLEAVRSIVRTEIQAIPKPEKIKPYLSIDEVCDLISLSKQTVYTMTHKKQIPHIKRSGKLLFNRAEIISWVQSSHQGVEK